jgi:hypothetical protein
MAKFLFYYAASERPRSADAHGSRRTSVRPAAIINAISVFTNRDVAVIIAS